MKFIKNFFFVMLIIVGSAYSLKAQAGASCSPGIANDCQINFNLPDCYVCDEPGGPGTGTCVPDDGFCDGLDTNQCRADICDPAAVPFLTRNVNPSGCLIDTPAKDAVPDFADICYYCSPPILINACGNGICDQAVEDCNNCPTDCLSLGGVCNANPTPPVGSCTAVPNPSVVCSDGDICTADACQQQQAPICVHTDLSCLPAADGCCPSGCTGPGPGGTCLDVAGAPIPGCDPDCCEPDLCGDEFVEPGETCDDGLPTEDAGIRADGTSVSKEECRDPGTVNECTFCGDGIVDAPTEQCDGAAANSCGAEGCNQATCLCNVATGCLEGSGSVTGGTGGPGCDGFTCSLNKVARPNSATNLKALLGFACFLVFAGLLRRRISS